MAAAIVAFLALFAHAMPGWAQGRFFVGTWEGTYRCGKTVNRLTLTLENRGKQIEGVFAFGPGPASPDHPTGSFIVVIQGNPSSFRIMPGEWIQQPVGFRTIGLSEKTMYNGRLEGIVDTSGCGSGAFGLDRVEVEAIRSGRDLVGEWKGIVSCGGFPVATSLEVSEAGEAIVSFGPCFENQLVPEGSYSAWITVDGDAYQFAPDKWIQKAPGFSLSFDVTLSTEGSSLTGKGAKCDDVSFARIEDGKAIDTDAMVTRLLPDFIEKTAASRLEEASGDLSAYLREKRPYLFTASSRQFAAGYAAGVRAKCSPALDYEVSDEIDHLIRNTFSVALYGDSFDSQDLTEVIGRQVSISAKFAAGVEAAKAAGCADPAAAEALTFIAELIRLNRLSPQGQVFLSSCINAQTEAECRCLGRVVEGLDPDIWRTRYSAGDMREMVAGNPAIGAEVYTSCRIERF